MGIRDRFPDTQLGVGKVPDSPGPRPDQTGGTLLRNAAGDGQNTHAGRVIPEIVLQLIRMKDGGARHDLPHHLGTHIKGGIQCEAAPAKAEILQKGTAQITQDVYKRQTSRLSPILFGTRNSVIIL